MAFYAVFLVVFTVGLSPEETCDRLQMARFSRIIVNVERSPSAAKRGEQLAILGSYWDHLCETDRVGASSVAVRKLAKLLRIRTARMMISSMLLDVGPHIGAASPELRRALRDQHNADQANLKRSFPFPPMNYRVVYRSLQCINHKILTTSIDPQLCRYVLAMRSQERG